MQLVNLKIDNFRGIKKAELFFSNDTVLVGDNNSGKSTILEAIDLVLGPERLKRKPIIDEHDFYAGKYFTTEDYTIEIGIETTVTGLNLEQEIHFRNHLQWWKSATKTIVDSPPAGQTDQEGVRSALRLKFRGYYDAEEDDFFGETFFLSPENEDGTFDRFGIKDKRICGFLYLRTLRTGSRALSLEHGSLLDIIMRIKELRPQMWEDILRKLRSASIAGDPEIGISDTLQSVQNAVRELVPIECADMPRIRVSQMTREHLREILTVFLGTGSLMEDGSEYGAPYHHQGTGTINALVLSLLSIIAELKENVIFAMEEPEIAIPPHTQKRVINSVINKSAQAIFASHSPYVLEEFDPSQIMVISRKDGELKGIAATYPPAVKQKKYRDEVKKRFCEALLARRILIVEGRTEYDAIPSAANRLAELKPKIYKPLEAIGIAVINAETDSQVLPLGLYFKKLGKIVYAIFDKQTEAILSQIEQAVDIAFEVQEKGFENLIVNHSDHSALKRYALGVVANGDWPPHLATVKPSETASDNEIMEALLDFFKCRKGSGEVADFIEQCTDAELPAFIKDTLIKIISHACPQISSTSEEVEKKGIDTEKTDV